jgi:hypothetical protein
VSASGGGGDARERFLAQRIFFAALGALHVGSCGGALLGDWASV